MAYIALARGGGWARWDGSDNAAVVGRRFQKRGVARQGDGEGVGMMGEVPVKKTMDVAAARLAGCWLQRFM